MCKTLFQAWAQAHHHKCRWALVFNTESMIVLYLADEHTLPVSSVIDSHAGERSPATTIASALFAFGLNLPPPPPSYGISIKVRPGVPLDPARSSSGSQS